jgi:hypothetical protein
MCMVVPEMLYMGITACHRRLGEARREAWKRGLIYYLLDTLFY